MYTTERERWVRAVDGAEGSWVFARSDPRPAIHESLPVAHCHIRVDMFRAQDYVRNHYKTRDYSADYKRVGYGDRYGDSAQMSAGHADVSDPFFRGHTREHRRPDRLPNHAPDSIDPIEL